MMFLLAARKGVRPPLALERDTEKERDAVLPENERPFVKFGLSLVRRPGPIYFVDPTKGNS